MISKKNIKRIILSLSIMICVIAVISCGGGKEMVSTWKTQEIKIDGNISDWQGSIETITDKKFAVGFKNDDKFLYICLITEDRMKIMQMLRAGFITWLTPNSDKNKMFGIKFPLVNKLSLSKEQLQNMNREMFQPGNQENNFNQYIVTQTELEIISKDKFPLNLLPIENNEGIKAKLGYAANNFVLELQISLASNHEYSLTLDARPGELINITFETEKLDLENMTGGMNRGGMQQGGRQTSGGQMGAGRMRQGAGQFATPEPINYSVDIKLQQQPK